MEHFVNNSLSVLVIEREAELSKSEAIISARLQQSKLKGSWLFRLKVSCLHHLQLYACTIQIEDSCTCLTGSGSLGVLTDTNARLDVSAALVYSPY